jgi:cell cycle arrest protein BUB3
MHTYIHAYIHTCVRWGVHTDLQAKKFAFKCHRRKVGEVEHVYPVNSIAFHPVFGTFATGGCDGIVCTWDAVNRRRVWQFKQYPSRQGV